jgi:hypothetical protein
MKEQEKEIKEIIEKLHLLPCEAKKAVCWLADNFDLIGRIADGSDISESQLEQYIEAAYERKDYTMLAILLHKQNNKPIKSERMRLEDNCNE